MTKLEQLRHVNKLIEEYETDFEVFICDLMKDLINSLPQGLSRDDEMIVLAETILHLFTKRIAYTLAPFNREHVSYVCDSMTETVLRDHHHFSEEFKKLVKTLSTQQHKSEEE